MSGTFSRDSTVAEVLAQFLWQEGAGKQRQITEQMRRAVRAGQLKPGEQIPSIQALAHIWGTNHFTVQKAMRPLVEEGLLDRQPRVGTRVRQIPANKCYGMYLGHRIFSDHGRIYFMSLYVALHTALAEAGYGLRLWVDSRPVKEHRTPPSNLTEAVRFREIRGLIAPGIREQELVWLKKLPLAVVGFGCPADPSFANTLCFDNRGLIAHFLERVERWGCRTVGMITPLQDLAVLFTKMCGEAGLETKPEWVPSHPEIHLNPTFGATSTRELLRRRKRPQALIIFPDTVVQGCLQEIWNSNLRVPERLRLCLHKNQGIEYFCPYPAAWAETSMSKTATAFIQVLQELNRGGKPTLPVTIPFGFSET